jgi:hypothetical protein
MKSVALTQIVKSLGRVLTLSCRVEIHGILKHTSQGISRPAERKTLQVCFRMLTTGEHYISTVNAYAVVTVFIP